MNHKSIVLVQYKKNENKLNRNNDPIENHISINIDLILHVNVNAIQIKDKK
jgi:hypothetical protein